MGTEARQSCRSIGKRRGVLGVGILGAPLTEPAAAMPRDPGRPNRVEEIESSYETWCWLQQHERRQRLKLAAASGAWLQHCFLEVCNT